MLTPDFIGILSVLLQIFFCEECNLYALHISNITLALCNANSKLWMQTLLNTLKNECELINFNNIANTKLYWNILLILPCTYHGEYHLCMNNLQ